MTQRIVTRIFQTRFLLTCLALASFFSITEPAFAQAAGSSTNDFIIQLAPFGIILIIMYVLILRPQQRRQREMAEMIKNVRRGDVIITTGGIVGKITKATDDNEVEIEIAPNVKVRLLRQMILETRAKSEPVKLAPKSDKSDKKASGAKEDADKEDNDAAEKTTKADEPS